MRRTGFFAHFLSLFSRLVLVLVMIFSSSATGLAVPIDSIGEPEVHGTEPIAVPPNLNPPVVKIPDSQVHMFIREGQSSRFELFFIDLRYGWDLVDFEFYKAWCLSKNKPLRRNALHRVRLYNYYSPSLPPELRGTRWNQINYIINHKNGPKQAVQDAIWHFTNGEKPEKLSREAAQLIEEANLKGKDYIPREDDLVAVVCVPEKGEQPVFMEYKIPQAVTFDVAPAAFTPPAVMEGGASFPYLIALAPLGALGLVVSSNGHNTPKPPPPHPPHDIPEPSSLVLLAMGIGAILIARKHTRKGC